MHNKDKPSPLQLPKLPTSSTIVIYNGDSDDVSVSRSEDENKGLQQEQNKPKTAAEVNSIKGLAQNNNNENTTAT